MDSQSKTVLVTGGAGYIGSHTIIALYEAGYTAVIVDDLSNSNRESVVRVNEIIGNGVEVPFYQADCTDKAAFEQVFAKHSFGAVIHFAGLKSVDQSIANPLQYYRNNIDSTLVLCELMQAHGVRDLIFSSSASVYGAPSELPLREDSTAGVNLTNPYGRTKFMIEQILKDVCIAYPDWQITILRYFNPIGAHPSGRIGEDPSGRPNNVLPYISQVAVGKLPELKVTGNDYDTPDGTGIRDYIHVMDLAEGHVAALAPAKAVDEQTGNAGNFRAYNLGTGHGTSVLELVEAFERASGKTVTRSFAPRRPGDIVSCYADCSKAERELGWRTRRSLQQACEDSWRWQSQNPNGYSQNES